MRAFRLLTAAVVAAALTAAASPPAMAQPEPAAPYDDWVRVDGDMVIGRDALAATDRHGEVPVGGLESPIDAPEDEGFAVFDPMARNYGTYTIRLRNSPDIETYRSILESTASGSRRSPAGPSMLRRG